MVDVRGGPRFSDRGLSVFCFALKLSCLSSLWCPDRAEWPLEPSFSPETEKPGLLRYRRIDDLTSTHTPLSRPEAVIGSPVAV